MKNLTDCEQICVMLLLLLGDASGCTQVEKNPAFMERQSRKLDQLRVLTRCLQQPTIKKVGCSDPRLTSLMDFVL